ncbi:rhomboid family intramembrane serine protease [Patescibacteria group bacterium]
MSEGVEMSNLARNCQWSFGVVALMWMIYAVGWVLPFDIKSFGIHPRELTGLLGVPFAPFIHASLTHLISNSVVLFVLLLIAVTYDKKALSSVIMVIILIGGLGTWIIGSGNSVHIGASGVIFGLMGYLLAVGYYRRDIKSIIVSIVIFFMYGGTILFSVFPAAGVSWSGHFFGFVAGILAVPRSVKNS